MKKFVEMLLLFAAAVFVSLLIREAILNSDLPDYIKFCTLTEAGGSILPRNTNTGQIGRATSLR